MTKGFYHIVHFWLKEGLGESERAAFVAGVKAIADSQNVQTLRVGTPAGTPRAVVDNSYDVQLIAVFEDKAAHDRYQSADDAVHTRFIESFKHCWSKVVIYDSLEA